MAAQSNFLPTCDPQLTPIVASRSGPFKPRRAVDSSGCLGSFYDACCDRVLPNLSFNFVTQSASSQNRPECFVATCKSEEYSNLLKWSNMHHELRLSVALQMVREMGVGALINYSRPIDKYTRFICYKYYDRTDYLSDEQFKSLSRNRSSMPNTLATHVIVLVNWGIDVMAVLQLPSDDGLTKEIDQAIGKICASLNNDQTSVVLSQNDKYLLEKIDHTEVFSNIPDLCKINSIIDFYRDIPRVKNNINLLKPYNYNLCPIQYFYDASNGNQGIFNELRQEHINTLECYLLQLSFHFNRLRTAMNQGYPNLERQLKDQLSEIRKRWVNLEQMHMYERQRFHDLVIGVRRGKINQNMIPGALDGVTKKELEESIENFDYELNVIQEKEHLIGDLSQKRFEYRNAIDYGVKNGDDEQTIACKVLANDKSTCVFCFSDVVRTKKKSEWGRWDTALVKQHKENPQLRIIYLDFSYCSKKLNDFIILPTTGSSSHLNKPKAMSISSLKQPKNDDIINILFLGESDVGKSTFINAFVNYLLFDTLEQAQKNSVVLIPVSFVMTFGDDFQERTLTFGGMDTLSIEDHGHTGQSVTQHCKSYVFTVKDGVNQGGKLRIIDTPGIGDVRGLAQDDINMQHILSYINNLTHLNAVCILMKPNNTRLTIFFRSCFMQLFDLFGENVRDKIIFCFTNARATFYTPGNTGPLLKNLLQSLPIKNVPFAKENTFCFDSESFRYLVAVQNGIKFSEHHIEHYKDSWDKSSNESKRFLEYICNKMTESLILGEVESMKDAQLKVSVMIRPILETMRNILRNIVLSNTGSRTESIELKPKIIKCTTAICFTCPRQYFQIGAFWITVDSLHVFHNKCQTCRCSPNDHYSIDYQLEYKPYHHSRSNFDTEMTEMLDHLCWTSAEFAHFLVGSTSTSQNDSFLTVFERMIKEEEDICKSKTSCQLNSHLLNSLKELKKKYEEAKNKLSVEKKHIKLSQVFDKIRHVNSYSMIESQMSAVKEWHKFMIKYYEYEVPIS